MYRRSNIFLIIVEVIRVSEINFLSIYGESMFWVGFYYRKKFRGVKLYDDGKVLGERC